MGQVGIMDVIMTDMQSIAAVILVDICSVIAAILVVVNKNPIMSVLFLIALFLGIACHLILAGITFIGLSYILVYVGAVSILFLFILMLINIRVSELATETRNTVPLMLGIGLIINSIVIQVLPVNVGEVELKGKGLKVISKAQGLEKGVEAVNTASSNSWESSISEVTNITNIGDIMYTNYSIWLIITSLILLLSMVGAIIITLKNRQEDK